MGAVLVLGVPRSGTTWVGEVLATTRGSVYVHEPDSRFDPYAFRVRIESGWIPDPDRDASGRLATLWAGALSGGRVPLTVRNRAAYRLFASVSPEQGLRALFTGRWTSPRLALAGLMAQPRTSVEGARNVIVKSVRSSFAAEFIHERFAPRVVVVERDPMNILASWKEMRFGHDYRELLTVADAASRRWQLRAPGPDAPVVTRQAFIVGTLVAALIEAADRHRDWHRVRHEVLCTDPLRRFRELVQTLDLEWDSKTERFLEASDSDGTGYETRRRASIQPERWRERLTAGEIDLIRETLEAFPLDLVRQTA